MAYGVAYGRAVVFDSANEEKCLAYTFFTEDRDDKSVIVEVKGETEKFVESIEPKSIVIPGLSTPSSGKEVTICYKSNKLSNIEKEKCEMNGGLFKGKVSAISSPESAGGGAAGSSVGFVLSVPIEITMPCDYTKSKDEEEEVGLAPEGIKLGWIYLVMTVIIVIALGVMFFWRIRIIRKENQSMGIFGNRTRVGSGTEIAR